MNVDRNAAMIAKWSAGPDLEFPPPPFPPQCFGGYEFLPIETCADLYSESLNMRHCAGGWAQIVSEGHYAAISIRQNGCREATALVEVGTARMGAFGPALMVRGYRGKPVPEIEALVREWLSHTSTP